MSHGLIVPALANDPIRLVARPFPVEGKEFLLTLGRQSVMNIFTASGFSSTFAFRFCEHRREKQNIMCRKSRFLH
jgi:hypothetical protein